MSTPINSPARQRLPRQPLVAALLAVVAVMAGAANLMLSGRDARTIAAGNSLVLAAEGVLSALKDIETGQRGYLLVGQEEYLAPYHAGIVAAAERKAALDALRVEAGLSQGDALQSLIERRITLATDSITLKRGGADAAAVRMVEEGSGKDAMDAIRVEIARLQGRAHAIVETRTSMSSQRGIWLVAITLGAALLGCAVIGAYALERRRAERRANALLEGVMGNAPMGLGFLDPSLRISAANQALSRLAEAAMGMAPSSGGGSGSLPEYLRARITPLLESVLRDGRTHAEVELDVHPPGEPEALHHLTMTLFPLRHGQAPGGDGRGVGLVLSDITRRKRAEARLRRSEARFRDLANSIPQMAWSTDATGRLLWTNRRWQDFAGAEATREWTHLLPEASAAEVTARLAAAFATGCDWEETFQLRGQDGAFHWFLARAVPINDDAEAGEAEGPLSGWFATFTDVTDMRAAQEDAQEARDAAEEANRAKSTFIANMSHELRTPLSAVIGYSEMLEEEAADLEGGASLTDDLRKIGSNARHLLSLINDVLDLSKIEAGRMELDPANFDVPNLVSDVTATVQTLIQRKGNRLELDLAPDLGTMHSDPVKLRQCLINLLSNASKFTEGGLVTLRAWREGGQVLFRVSDTGIGMTEEQLGRLFTRFTQADASTTRRFGGTGLGLAITRAFCALLGGGIGVESTLGQGTSFTMNLPAELPAPTAAEDPPTEAEAAAPAGTVLVVDDDPASRELLSRFVRRDGFAVRTAADGEEGLRMARALKPVAVLLDVMMPRLDGWAVLTALKADPELADIPVVMVSFLQERGLAVSLGAADYLVKPVQWGRLKQVLEQYRAPGAALLVDADAATRAELRHRLEAEGWTVAEANCRTEALERLDAAPPIVLVMVAVPGPGDDGLALVQALRERALPVIALTGGQMPADELEALQAQVRRVLPADDNPPMALLAELRRLAQGSPGAAAALHPPTRQDTP